MIGGNSENNLQDASAIEQNQSITKSADKSAFEDLENDELLAEMLQREFNTECDNLNSDQGNFNSDSRQQWDSESDLEEEIDVYDKEVWDKLDTMEKKLQVEFPRDYKSEKKHSVVLNKNKNAYKLLTFTPTGQVTKDTKDRKFKNFGAISEYDKKKIRNKQEQSKEFYPSYSAYCKSKIDSYGLSVIKKMIHKQLLLRVNDILHLGTYANLFQAECNQSYSNKLLPKTCVIKVFKVTYFNESSQMITKLDFETHVQREVMGLKKLQGIVPCPQLISHKGHVVVMSFVGEMHQPAPTINDAKVKPKEYFASYKEVIGAMKTMYRKGKLIHGSLNERSILWHHKKCYFINFQECLEPHEEQAYYRLHTDCKSVTDFFKYGEIDVPNILTVNGLFEYITGCSYIKKSGLIQSEQREDIEN